MLITSVQYLEYFFFYKCMMCPTYVLNKLGSQGQYSLCDNAFYFVNSLKLGCTLLKNNYTCD